MCERKNPGDVIADRYVITDILANHPDRTVYLATDYNEHQRWCSICECQVIPEEGDPFCDECGSELQPGRYRLTIWSVDAEPSGLDVFVQTAVDHDNWHLPIDWFISNDDRIMVQTSIEGQDLDAIQASATRDEIMSWGLTLADMIRTSHTAGFLGFQNKTTPFVVTEDHRLIWMDWQGFTVFPADPSFGDEDVHKARQMDLAALASMLTVWLIEEGGDLPVEVEKDGNPSDKVGPALHTFLNDLSSDVYTDAGAAAAKLEALFHPESVEDEETVGPISPVPVRYVAASRSDVGQLRRGKVNEDSLALFDLTAIRASMQETIGMYVVADGVGGHDSGEVASRIAAAAIINHMVKHLVNPSLDGLTEEDEARYTTLMVEAVHTANTAVVKAGKQTQADINTTITAVLLIGLRAYIANVGDSRTYLYRDGQLRALTVDHSLVARLVAIGMIEKDEMYTHPQKNQIYRVVGSQEEFEVDTFVEPLLPGDILLLCSDGLWDMIRDPDIEDILQHSATPVDACDALVDRANKNGGEDNISAIVVQATAYENEE